MIWESKNACIGPGRTAAYKPKTIPWVRKYMVQPQGKVEFC
jgi:hypothetical protein